MKVNNIYIISVQFHQVKVVEWHVMSISSKNEHKSVFADLSGVTISGCWLNSLNDSEVGAIHNAWGSSHSLESGALASHVMVHSVSSSSELSPSHLLEVSFEGLVSVLNDETVLHRNGCWGRQSTLLLLGVVCCRVRLFLWRLAELLSCLFRGAFAVQL